MKCSLSYIPEYLHSEDRPIVKIFQIGENLFYRCKDDQCKKPYDSIPLYDISHNRDFSSTDEYPKDDVFYNVIPDDPREKYDDLDLVILSIRNIKEFTYIKEIISTNDPDLKALITLLHQPIPCMYPHSVFEIKLNGEVVSKENYKKTLGKKNATFSNLRTLVRQELTSIIQTGNIDSSTDFEFISEP